MLARYLKKKTCLFVSPATPSSISQFLSLNWATCEGMGIIKYQTTNLLSSSVSALISSLSLHLPLFLPSNLTLLTHLSLTVEEIQRRLIRLNRDSRLYISWKVKCSRSYCFQMPFGLSVLVRYVPIPHHQLGPERNTLEFRRGKHKWCHSLITRYPSACNYSNKIEMANWCVFFGDILGSICFLTGRDIVWPGSLF